MSELNERFVHFRGGRDSREDIVINACEIASYQSRTVVSYSYEEWIKVTLKSGIQLDVRASVAEFEARLREATS